MKQHIIDADELEKLIKGKIDLYDSQMEGADYDDFIRNEWAAGAMRQLLKDLRALIANSPQADGMVLVANEAMKDLARPFLLGLELGIKQFKPMVKHLEMSGAYLPQWFIESEGHLNKMAKAHYIFEAMLSAYKPQADDVRKDAERYRWIRANPKLDICGTDEIAEFDAMIDRAMGKARE